MIGESILSLLIPDFLFSDTLLKMKINAQRLLENINRYAQIGKAGKIGVERIALSDLDKEARDLLKSQMLELGLEIFVDEIGNMIGLRKGQQDVHPVATGSHLDTVYQGGRYDGALGVLAGLEVVQTLNDHSITTQKPIAIINFTNEEGVNFSPDMMGSHAFAELGDLNKILASQAYDDPSRTVESELKRIGYKGDLKCGQFPLDSFLELHIEQGPVLEVEKLDVGAVEMVQGIYWTRYKIIGEANHAGTTPLNYRKDAGYAAGKFIQYVGDYVRSADHQILSTIGTLKLEPNGINIVPQSAEFTLDLRSVDREHLNRGQQEMDTFLNGLVEAFDLQLEKEEMVRFAPVQFDADVVSIIDDSAKEMGLTVKRMPSGAGHDAQMMASICPTAMIFIPSVKGISHNVEEFSNDQDVVNGANVLLNSILKITEI